MRFLTASLVLVAGLSTAGCSKPDPLIGSWRFADTGEAGVGIEFRADGTTYAYHGKGRGDSGTYSRNGSELTAHWTKRFSKTGTETIDEKPSAVIEFKDDNATLVITNPDGTRNQFVRVPQGTFETLGGGG